jgi:sec-independent protein translocase protein TatB
MFDVAPSELLIVAIVALVVIGPKDLPKALRFVGHWVGKARGMARHFRSGLDTMMREAELDDMEKKWREHNEAIMRAYPNIDGNLPPVPPSGGTTTQPYGPQMLPIEQAPSPVPPVPSEPVAPPEGKAA